jgi:hypothetical protein
VNALKFCVFINAINLAACCHKKDCISVNFDIIRLNGFNLSPNDTIWLDKAPPNQNFALLHSTNYYFPHTYSTGDQVIDIGDFDFNADYRLRIPSTGDEFRITHIHYELQGCNKCYPTGQYDYYYENLKSYLVNGQLKQNGRIIIEM